MSDSPILEDSPVTEDSPTRENSHVIEIWGEAVGITVPEGGTVRFHAAAPHFIALDGRRFSSVGQARLAAVRHHRSQSHSDDGGVSHGQGPFARYDLTDSSTAYWSQ